ncbi:MAG: hypothetical protein GPJ54_16245 [Candidatus Heimdallarchaeota archaeon]|nr:hypothetical protein [Candidatus Heimdallarchaeota archaeon]
MTTNAPGFIENFVERDQIIFEKGCLRYRVFQQETNENIITLLLEWDSKDNYDKYYKDNVEQVIGKYSEGFEDLELIDLLTVVEGDLSDSDFYVLSRLTVNRDVVSPNELINEILDSYPKEMLQKINCEKVEIFTNSTNIKIVSMLGKWKDKSSYLTWYKSQMRYDVNVRSDALGKELGPDHYKFKLIRSRLRETQ